jgi:hypothetical protein
LFPEGIQVRVGLSYLGDGVVLESKSLLEDRFSLGVEGGIAD